MSGSLAGIDTGCSAMVSTLRKQTEVCQLAFLLPPSNRTCQGASRTTMVFAACPSNEQGLIGTMLHAAESRGVE